MRKHIYIISGISSVLITALFYYYSKDFSMTLIFFYILTLAIQIADKFLIAKRFNHKSWTGFWGKSKRQYRSILSNSIFGTLIIIYGLLIPDMGGSFLGVNLNIYFGITFIILGILSFRSPIVIISKKFIRFNDENNGMIEFSLSNIYGISILENKIKLIPRKKKHEIWREYYIWKSDFPDNELELMCQELKKILLPGQHEKKI